jgi:hypothetical protein
MRKGMAKVKKDEYELTVGGEIFRLVVLVACVALLTWHFHTLPADKKFYHLGDIPEIVQAFLAALFFGYVVYKAAFTSICLLLVNPLLAILAFPVMLVVTMLGVLVIMFPCEFIPDRQLGEKLMIIIPMIVTGGTAALHVFLLIGAIRG